MPLSAKDIQRIPWGEGDNQVTDWNNKKQKLFLPAQGLHLQVDRSPGTAFWMLSTWLLCAPCPPTLHTPSYTPHLHVPAFHPSFLLGERIEINPKIWL